MSENPSILSPGGTWLIDQWIEKFVSVLESMCDEHPTLDWSTEGEDELGDKALIVEQRVAGTPEPILWIGMPETVYQEIGGTVLRAAGVQGSEAEENRATALEIVEQSIGGLLSIVGKRLSREIKREPSRLCEFFPNGLTVIRCAVTIGETALIPLWAAFNPLFVTWLDEEKSAPAATPSMAAALGANSPKPEAIAWDDVPEQPRNFDLLLDVALPVSVSFGKTDLAVRMF